MSGILATNKHNLEWDYEELVNELREALAFLRAVLILCKWKNNRQTKCNQSLAIATLNLTKMGKIDIRTNILYSPFTVYGPQKKRGIFFVWLWSHNSCSCKHLIPTMIRVQDVWMEPEDSDCDAQIIRHGYASVYHWNKNTQDTSSIKTRRYKEFVYHLEHNREPFLLICVCM